MRLVDDRTLPAGATAGLVGLIISFAGRGTIPGRVLGDPLPMALAVGRVAQGFAYFDWRSPLFHALFASFLGVLAAVVVWFSSRHHFTGERARLAGRIAAAINVGVVAILQVDALVVGFWYLMAGAMSFFLTSFVAGRIADAWQRLAQEKG
jgi:hypothetical protein